ncbi:hypothetical protein NL676_023383 [Syzygium grande]|nr:hypothetical protein NL676_023383 [Syzygium grande]
MFGSSSLMPKHRPPWDEHKTIASRGQTGSLSSPLGTLAKLVTPVPENNSTSNLSSAHRVLDAQIQDPGLDSGLAPQD